MSDYYCATFNVLKSDIERYPELKKEITLTFYDKKGKLINEDNWSEESPVACFIDEQAHNGLFEELETLCVKLKVPYDRWSASYDYDSETVAYRPDIGTFSLDGETGQFMCPANKLRDLASDIDMKTEKGLLELGTKFASFLSTIPDIRPLEEYENYNPDKE